MKRFRIIWMLVLALVVAVGCRKENTVSGDSDAVGSLSLSFSLGDLETKADPVAADGDCFHNVLVLVANEENKLVDSKYHDHGDTYMVTDTLHFWNLRVGAYHVYAYANIDQTAWQSDQTIALVEKKLNAVRVTGGDPVKMDRLLKVFDSKSAPTQSSTGAMLLTGHEVLSVGSKENIGEVPLKRPVCRLKVFLNNHTKYLVRLTDLRFSSFNPSHSYLLSHWSDAGIPTLPVQNVYGDLPAFSAPVDVSSGSGNYLVYSTLLYENAYEDGYLMYADVTMDPTGTSPTNKILSDGRPKLLSNAKIAAMAVGDTYDVMLLNPNTKNGAFFGRSGNSGVATWSSNTTEDAYAVKAKEILENSELKSKYTFTLKREADDDAGNKLFSLSNGGTNILAANGGNGKKYAFLEMGSVADLDSSSPISSDFEGYLVRFRTDAWGNLDYFRNHGNANPYYQDQKQGTDYKTSGLYQWALYDANRAGSKMRLIDNETAQVSDLSYMRRNQELNVVMNVYYQENERDFAFTVDNAYWTQSHSMSHIFK